MTNEEFDLQKKKLELEIIQKQLTLKALEISKLEKENHNKPKLTPVTATIIVAFLGLSGTFLANYFQQQTAMEIEKRKTLFAIYSKAQESEDPETAAKILDFYIAMNLIEGEKGQFTKAITSGEESDSVPPIFDGNRRTIEKSYRPEDLVIPSAGSSSEWRISNNYLVGSNVTQQISPNTSGKFEDGFPDAIVIHYTAGPKLGSVKYLQDGTVSASSHFIVGKDGEVVQLVPLNYEAWGAGKSEYAGREGWNAYSIHIDIVNAGVLEKRGEKYYTWYNMEIPKENVIKAKHKHKTTDDYWEVYTPKQIETVKKLCAIVIKNYNIDYIVGHDDLSKGRKLEPGPTFPMEELEKLLKK